MVAGCASQSINNDTWTSDTLLDKQEILSKQDYCNLNGQD